ncbi:MAG: type VI secretion system contractile sheath small subunit [Desulfovibrionaceae bacterium]|nr:type VI secretion system contractile sheath small subunit [Desulfovibrionaceae bacterium]
MAGKEGSVAPKERVNIVYRPATGNAQEDVELPLKLMVLGDFTNQTDERPVEDREPVSIDKDNFNSVMAGQGIGLKISVPNRITEEQDSFLTADLKFSGMRDFEPDAIVRQIPELMRLIELRDALKALKGPLANVPDFRRKVQDMVTDADARARLLKELGIEEEKQ